MWLSIGENLGEEVDCTVLQGRAARIRRSKQVQYDLLVAVLVEIESELPFVVSLLIGNADRDLLAAVAIAAQVDLNFPDVRTVGNVDNEFGRRSADRVAGVDRTAGS